MSALRRLTLVMVFTVPVTAAPVMTRFDPATHGFRFVNDFVNDFVPALNIRTGGLCGGMTYSALDFYNAHQPVPNQDWRPANGTTLQGYLYNRQVDSIMGNLDRWAEVGFNPGGARNDEFFRWGLDGRAGGRIAELRSFIDRGVPVPIGLPGADGKSGNHQMLAIGYDLGRYRGDFGANQEDFKVYVCDPNRPTRTMRLVPDTSAKIWVLEDDTGAKLTKTGWQTYFVDKKYGAKTPPRLPNPNYPADGKLHELIVTFQTGADDLRGGNDNVNLTLNLADRSTQVYPNINRGARWIPNYRESECIVLRTPVAVNQIRSLVISTTFGGGIGGDNWDMLYVEVRGRGGGGLDLPHIAQAGLHRFTGDDKQITVPVSAQPAGPRGLANVLKLKFWTGSDDLRGGNDNVNVTVRYRNGRQLVFNNVNRSQRWADKTLSTVVLPLSPAVLPADIVQVIIATTFGGGMGGDNWDMDGVEVRAEGNGVDQALFAYEKKRFTGSDKTLTLPAP